MAIKGKRRRRGGARTAGAPKPRIEPRKRPLLQRRGFRWGALAVLTLVAIVIVLIVLRNLSRSGDLKDYAAALSRAEEPFITYASSGQAQSLPDLHQQFQAGALTTKQLRDAATTWEQEFGKARDAVRRLRPPDAVRDANEMIAQSFDLYVGIARLYAAAAEQKDLERAGRNENQRKRLQTQTTSILTHIAELRGRADQLYQAGIARIEERKTDWGVRSEHPRTPTGGQAPGGAPPGLPPGVPGLPGGP